MLRGNLKGVNELPHSLQPGKDGVLSSEGIFPEEDLKGGLILMLAILEVWIGAGELVKIIEEKIYLVLEVVGHVCYLIIMFGQLSFQHLWSLSIEFWRRRAEMGLYIKITYSR